MSGVGPQPRLRALPEVDREMREPQTDAGRRLLGWMRVVASGELPPPIETAAPAILAIETEAGNYALEWTLTDIEAERRWMLEQRADFGPAEKAMLRRLDATIAVLGQRVATIRARAEQKNA